MTVVTLEKDRAVLRLSEGKETTIPVAELVNRLAPEVIDTQGLMLPPGTRWARRTPGGFVLVHETPNVVMNLRWIARESEAPYGEEAIYRDVRLSLPYIVVFAHYGVRARQLVLSDRNECYFRTSPLKSEDDPLFFPALLNCSRFSTPEGHPLSWICTQNLDRGPLRGMNHPNRYLQASLGILLHHLFHAAFNRSSELSELTSWFTSTVDAGVDPRLASVEAWEEGTRENPLMALDVPWLPTGLSVKQVTERVASGMSVKPVTTAEDVARLILRGHRSLRRPGLFDGVVP